VDAVDATYNEVSWFIIGARVDFKQSIVEPQAL
jgi:hypothetical protein